MGATRLILDEDNLLLDIELSYKNTEICTYFISAALAEPYSCVVHTFKRAAPLRIGQKILILGAGIIGKVSHKFITSITVESRCGASKAISTVVNSIMVQYRLSVGSVWLNLKIYYTLYSLMQVTSLPLLFTTMDTET